MVMGDLDRRVAAAIMAKNTKLVLKGIDAAVEAKAKYGIRDLLAEWRADFTQSPEVEVIVDYAKERGIPLIATCRDPEEAGPGRKDQVLRTEKKRISILQRAIKRGVEYVDIEYPYVSAIDTSTNPNDLGENGKTILIVSYHNFEETPENIEEIRDYLVATGAPIIKMATAARTMEDSLRMMRLVRETIELYDMIGISMGKEGVEEHIGTLTRVLGPVYGGYLSFAPLTEATAPGQLNIEGLHKRIVIADRFYKEGKIRDPLVATAEDFEMYHSEIEREIKRLAA